MDIGRRRADDEPLLAGAGGPDFWTEGLWHSLLRRRTIGVFVLALLAVALPSLGAERWVIGAFLLLVETGYHGVLNRAFTGGRPAGRRSPMGNLRS